MSALISLPSRITSKPDARTVLVPSHIEGVIQRCLDLLQVYIRNFPPTTNCNANSVHESSEIVLLLSVSDYAETCRGGGLIVWRGLQTGMEKTDTNCYWIPSRTESVFWNRLLSCWKRVWFNQLGFKHCLTILYTHCLFWFSDMSCIERKVHKSATQKGNYITLTFMDLCIIIQFL
jgi:hypothetical protein